MSEPTGFGAAPGALVLALKSEDRPFEFRFNAESMEGDLNETSVQIIAPSGKLVKKIPIPRDGRSTRRDSETLPADGEVGLYRIEYRSREASIHMPVTDLEAEAAVWPKNEAVRAKWFAGELFLSESKEPIELTISSISDKTAVNYQIADAKGHSVAAGSLFKARDKTDARVTLDPARHPLPWRIEVVGHASLAWRGQGVIIWGQTPEGLRRMLAALEKYPRPGDPHHK